MPFDIDTDHINNLSQYERDTTAGKQGLLITESNRDEFWNTYKLAIPRWLFEQMQDLILSYRRSIFISEETLGEIQNRRLMELQAEWVMEFTAETNNKGIQAEKEGRIEDAIHYYEANIKVGDPATHSFNRLMVIYKRQKRFRDEIRVIDEALSVFSEANRLRFQAGIGNLYDLSGWRNRKLKAETARDKALVLASKNET